MVKHHGERSKLLIVITSKSSLRIRFPVDKATLDHISPSIYDKYEPQNCEEYEFQRTRVRMEAR